MGIKASSSGDSIDIVITGQVRGVSEIEEIKSAINDQGNASSIKMTLEDAFVVPSAFIGYLLKLSQVEGKDITIVTFLTFPPIGGFIFDTATLVSPETIDVKSRLMHMDGSLCVVYLNTYKQIVVMDRETYNSAYVQMFMLGKYDKNLFELVSSSIYSRIYKVK